MIAAFFVVVFTGRWPDGLRRFMVGTGRLVTRLNAYGRLLVDEYPPFSLDPSPAAGRPAPMAPPSPMASPPVAT